MTLVVLLLNYKNSSDLGDDDTKGRWTFSSHWRITDRCQLQDMLWWGVDVAFACKSILTFPAASWLVKALQKFHFWAVINWTPIKWWQVYVNDAVTEVYVLHRPSYIFSPRLAQNYGTLTILSRSKLFPSVNTSTLYISKLCDKELLGLLMQKC